jgi:hypothetical protein
MRNHTPDLSVLADRDCLIAFAAMALSCDNAVHAHEMGYHQGGTAVISIAYITAKGVTQRTGLSRATAERALQRLETAGLAIPNTDGSSWRTDADILTPTPADDQ